MSNSDPTDDKTLYAISECACLVLKENDVYFHDDTFIETLKSTFIHIVTRSIKNSTDLISQWT